MAGQIGPALTGLGALLSNKMLSLHKQYPTSFVAEAGINMAQTWYPQWTGKSKWLVGHTTTGYEGRVDLGELADHAASVGLEYEGLSFNLENGSHFDPDERADPVGAFARARGVANQHGVWLMSALGGGYESLLADQVVKEIARLCDWWLYQGQRLQIYAPGVNGTFRKELIKRLRRPYAGNRDLNFVVQLTTWSGFTLTSEQIYAYVRDVEWGSNFFPIRHVTLGDYGHDPNPPSIIDGTMNLYYPDLE